MAEPRDKAYLDPYREAVRSFGPGFEATLWNSRAAQTLRFDVMIDLAGFEGCSLLDIGCGQGDLAARLIERGVGFARYTGVDAVAEMIEAAKRRGLPRCQFVTGDPVGQPGLLASPPADWACVSGTLNTMDEETAETLVAGAFQAAAQGVVFNFLSSRDHPRWAGRDPAPARRFDPLRWLAFALELSTRVTFTQAYMDGHDGTVMVQHE